MENLLVPHNQTQKSTLAPDWSYRTQAFANLLRMGHCAPTVMKTILDITSTEKEWLVRLSAGMPGGIGNTGFERGGITSPLVLLGTQFSLRQVDQGLPVIFDKGHALFQNFVTSQKIFRCTEIRQNDHFPRHCITPVLPSPELFMDAQNFNHREATPPVNQSVSFQILCTSGRKKLSLRPGGSLAPWL